jgi:hypothetical protein
MGAKRQATIPRQIVDELLAAAGDDLVLIGGQSLATWMGRYGVAMPGGFDFVSRDVDFLAASRGDKASVKRLARALGGRAAFPPERAAFTSLIGQAIRELSEDEVFNVDVLHAMWGAETDQVRNRAQHVRDGELEYRVLHPLDVLKSRLDNLHGLKEKQNDLGKAQLVAAIDVARAYLREQAALEPREAKRPVTLRYVGFIQNLAMTAAGKKVATRHGIHVADAIEPDAVRSKEFREKTLPRLVPLMSPARRREISRHA